MVLIALDPKQIILTVKTDGRTDLDQRRRRDAELSDLQTVS